MRVLFISEQSRGARLPPGLAFFAARLYVAALMNADFQLGRPAAEARIVVAMSGGVDSSVVAALAARSGAEVIGVTLQLYDHGEAVERVAHLLRRPGHLRRQGGRRRGSASPIMSSTMRAASGTSVIERFADEYAQGRTPIPCISCNQGVKFTDLLGLARDLGADCLATGHYVRRVRSGRTAPELHRAADPARDQSYFLFATTRDQLDYLRFPLGDLPKPAVREIARELGLIVADKPDSQDICFVPDGDYAAVVKKVRPEAARGGRDRRPRRARARPASRPHPFHRRPAPRAGDRRPARAALRRPARAGDAARRRRSEARARRSAARGCRASTGWARRKATG